MRRIACIVAVGVMGCGDDGARGGGDADASAGTDTSVGTDAVGSDASAETDAGTDVAGACGITDPSVLAAGHWDERFTVAGFTGHDGFTPFVHDFAFMPDGSLLATGDWQWFGTSEVEPLMKRDAAGAWSSVPLAVDSPAGFAAVAVDGSGKIALATNDTFGDRDGSIVVDGVAIGDFTGQVRSLAWYDGELWAAGLFAFDVGTPQELKGLAVWDGSDWKNPPLGPIGGSGDENRGFAFELTVVDDRLWVGGTFTGVGNIDAENVAMWDGTTWTARDLPNIGVVYALAVDDQGVVYAGGALGDQGDGGGGIVRWGEGGWELLGGGLSMYSWPGVVTDIVAAGDDVDVVGCFVAAGGAADAPGIIASRAVARWSADHWVALDDGSKGVIGAWFEPLTCGDEGITAVWDVGMQRAARVGDTLYVGGSFSGVAGVQSNVIAAHDGTSWKSIGASGLGVSGSLDRIEASCDGTVWGTGQFSHLGGEPANARVARFDGDGWTAFPDPLAKDAYCPAFAVSREGDVALGCMEFPPEGDATGAVLVHEAQLMVRAPIAVAPVQALAYTPSGRLWVGGGGATGFLGYVEGDAFTSVLDDLDGPVQFIEVVSDGELLIGGTFTHRGANEVNRIARVVDGEVSALGSGLPGQPTAIGVASDGHVFASSYNEGNGFFVLGEFDGSNWVERATTASGMTAVDSFSVMRMRAVGDTLVLVGTIELDDHSGRGALLYKDGTFSALAGGVGAISVSGIALTDDAVWIGGLIAQAGAPAKPSVGLARFIPE